MGAALVCFFSQGPGFRTSTSNPSRRMGDSLCACPWRPGAALRVCTSEHPETVSALRSESSVYTEGGIMNRQQTFRPTPRTLDTTANREVFQHDRFTTVLLTRRDGNEFLSGIGGLLILVSGDDDACDRGVNRPHTLDNPYVRRAIWV